MGIGYECGFSFSGLVGSSARSLAGWRGVESGVTTIRLLQWMGTFEFQVGYLVRKLGVAMAGREYLEDIKAQLESGRHQSRMGENVLRAFGYVRRRATAIEEINATLEQLGLAAYPPVSSDMALKDTPYSLFVEGRRRGHIARNRRRLRRTGPRRLWLPIGGCRRQRQQFCLSPPLVFPSWYQQIQMSSACHLVNQSKRPMPRCAFASTRN